MTETMTWVAAGYGTVLLLVAYGIDQFARRAQTAHEKQQTPGFTYHEDHDAWQCPEDQWLWPQSFDPDNRVMRYRGSPTVCNSCPVKDSCTTSDDGREMKRMIDVWPASESAKFHRGIACAVAVLAAAWPLATTFTLDDAAGQLLLLAVTLGIVLASLPLWSHLRRTQAVPEGVRFKTLDENLADRTVVAEAVARRRTSYASDRREPEDA
ncbi:hypothetical protein [Georgenia sp. H159]|uniref:hypothetical protein n=1 Tax=Georgenia sp. H159 TaxID=3076115 RepID=UPI002D79E892|nr:hypothetical protein [Georgenia sp. H159]